MKICFHLADDKKIAIKMVKIDFMYLQNYCLLNLNRFKQLQTEHLNHVDKRPNQTCCQHNHTSVEFIKHHSIFFKYTPSKKITKCFENSFFRK